MTESPGLIKLKLTNLTTGETTELGGAFTLREPLEDDDTPIFIETMKSYSVSWYLDSINPKVLKLLFPELYLSQPYFRENYHRKTRRRNKRC